ncbi:MAG: PilZ domain-containing protein [Omnitrophica bacterium]|nr:PilZ domain-containing protein [Candidatus Omnitrophota bacterium]
MATRAKERRRRRRIDVAIPIEIAYNKEKVAAQTKNVSILGTYIEIDKEIPTGTSLEIKIKIPATTNADIKNRQINCQGFAFRSHHLGLTKSQYGTGIFFRAFLKNGEGDLSRYIDYVLKQEKKMGKIYTHKRRRKGGKG